jgi:hypothetical protein
MSSLKMKRLRGWVSRSRSVSDQSASSNDNPVEVIAGQSLVPTKDPRKVRLNARLRAATRKSIEKIFSEFKKQDDSLGDRSCTNNSSQTIPYGAQNSNASASNSGENINDQSQEPENLTLLTTQQRDLLSTKDMEIALLRSQLDHSKRLFPLFSLPSSYSNWL